MITPQQDYANRLKAWLKREAELRAENERLKLALGESEQLRSAQVDAVSTENERLRAGLNAAEGALYTLAEWSTAPGGIVAPDHTVCGPKVPLIRFAREARMAAERALAPEHPPSGSKP